MKYVRTGRRETVQEHKLVLSREDLCEMVRDDPRFGFELDARAIDLELDIENENLTISWVTKMLERQGDGEKDWHKT